MSRNIVTQSVMRLTNTVYVKRRFVETEQNGFQSKLTPSFLILTTVRVPVRIPPEVAMPAQTQRIISTAPSQEFVSTENCSVMATSTVSMEKMKTMIPAIQHILRIKSSLNTEQCDVLTSCTQIFPRWLWSAMESLNVSTRKMSRTSAIILQSTQSTSWDHWC